MLVTLIFIKILHILEDCYLLFSILFFGYPISCCVIILSEVSSETSVISWKRDLVQIYLVLPPDQGFFNPKERGGPVSRSTHSSHTPVTAVLVSILITSVH